MIKNFSDPDWKKYLPEPVCREHPEYGEFYMRAWELAHDHIKYVDGMPQNPYMDEAFCDSQVWIWDTCFMSLFCKFAQEAFPGVETFRNFYEVLYGGKVLPEIIPGENEPVWTGATPGVSTNIKVHIADNPPLFAWAEYENALIHGNIEYIKDLLYNSSALQRHYEWIEGLRERVNIKGVLLPTNLVNHGEGYTWEGGSSGMDNTPRGRKEIPSPERPNNPDMLWLDAICQQALSAKAIAKLFSIVGDADGEKEWNKRFEHKRDIINRLYWDSEDGFYYDINKNDHSLYKVMTSASFWTMTAEVATEDRARELIKRIGEDDTLGGDLPLLSLARNDADYKPTGKYWRGSLWLPVAYAALKGISTYGYHKEAHEAGYKIFKRMLDTYHKYEPHTIWECYAPEANTPATQTNDVTIVRPDFCGWSALGPISVYLEYVLGFHGINSFERLVEWEKPEDMGEEVGIKNLRFGDVVTDIVAEGNICRVSSNAPYMLKINGVAYAIDAGESVIRL